VPLDVDIAIGKLGKHMGLQGSSICICLGKAAMNKILTIFLLGFLSLATLGCVPARTYLVQVNGYTDSAAPLLAPGASFFVVENQKAQNPLVEKEIKRKIEDLLVKNGYLLAPYDKAQYYLFFSFGLGAPQTVSVTSPLGPGRCWSDLGYSAYVPTAYGPMAKGWPSDLGLRNLTWINFGTNKA